MLDKGAASSEWRASLLRFTGFFAAPSDEDLSSWWNRIASTGPDEETKNLREGRTTLVGNVREGQLTLTKTPERVDLLLEAAKDDSASLIRTIDAVGGAFSSFHSLCQRLLIAPDFSILKRMAFGPVLFFSTSSKEDAYALMSRLTGIPLEAATQSDVMFQINKPRPSRIDESGLLVNRLTKWSAVVFMLQRFEFQGTSPIVSPMNRPAVENACKLECDINTAADYSGALNPENFTELMEIAQTVTEKGEEA